MNVRNIISEIKSALAKLPGRDFSDGATELMGTLGYTSDLRPESQPATVDDFIKEYKALTLDTESEQSFRESAKSIRVLFQFTDQEVATQDSLFNVASFDTGNARSFLFTAVELKGDGYARGRYAAFTREINKR